MSVDFTLRSCIFLNTLVLNQITRYLKEHKHCTDNERNTRVNRGPQIIFAPRSPLQINPAISHDSVTISQFVLEQTVKEELEFAALKSN